MELSTPKKKKSKKVEEAETALVEDTALTPTKKKKKTVVEEETQKIEEETMPKKKNKKKVTGKMREIRFEVKFNSFPSPFFKHVCSRRLLKTLWEKEKLLKTSSFSSFHSVFLPFFRTFVYFHRT